MNRVGQFEKVSFEQFKKDYLHALLPGADYKDLIKAEENALIQAYDTISLPVRATSGSAGYDFVSPIDFMLNPGESITIPTGIRVKIDEGWFLGIFPKSSLGFKFRVQLDNTVGVIDSDYYYSDNQGHIMVKITNDSKTSRITNNNNTYNPAIINRGKAFVQGIFIPFGVTYDDQADGVRNGGFGSTGM